MDLTLKCPTCGWSMKQEEECEAQGFVVGKYFCAGDCPTIVIIKSPLDWMVAKGRWK